MPVDEILAAAGDDGFRSSVRRWLEAHRADVVSSASVHDVAVRRRWEDHLCRCGWAGLGWPTEFGGKGLSLARQEIFHEEHARCRAPLPLNAIGHDILGPTLMLCGTQDQQRRFLPRILTNEDIWCQGYSEPSAGSDLASLRTRARRDGDDYCVQGQKIWTSFASEADWCFVLARSDPAAPKHRGLTFLLLDMKSPGVSVRPIRQITGEADFCEVFFDDVRVPAANRVGAEHGGWAVAMQAASFERSIYFLPRLVRMQAELIDLAQLAKRTETNEAPTIDAPLLHERLGRSLIDVYLLRLQVRRMLDRQARGEAPGPESSFIKLLWSESHQRLLDLAMDVLGRRAAYGPQEFDDAAEGRWWQRDFLWSRAETILAGTSEIQRNIIAERVLGLPR